MSILFLFIQHRKLGTSVLLEFILDNLLVLAQEDGIPILNPAKKNAEWLYSNSEVWNQDTSL